MRLLHAALSDPVRYPPCPTMGRRIEGPICFGAKKM